MPFLVASSKEPTYYAGDMGSIPGPEDPLKKEMATHSGILACEIPWTEETGGLGHNLATKPPPSGERCCTVYRQNNRHTERNTRKRERTFVEIIVLIILKIFIKNKK